MSDTTTTITPEERALWFKDAQPKSVSHYEPIDFEMDKRIRRLLAALEAAEKALLKEEVYSEELESQLQDADGEYNANWAVQAISDVARLVGVYEHSQEIVDDMGTMSIEAVQELLAEKQRAEANVTRLTNERDWLAELVFDRPCAYACCPFDKHRPTGPDDDDCDKTHIQCWAEAARKAVAGEGKE